MDLDALPLFPLHTVLFPGGLLPLQIFEVRYLDLMKRCQQTGEPFGVVCLRSGQEVRRAPRDSEDEPPAETLHEVGTLATLVYADQPQPGLMLVVAQGGQRFRLQHAHVLPHGLWTGAIELLPEDPPALIPDELMHLSTSLHELLHAIEPDQMGHPPPLEDPRWRDAGWVANRWAERLPWTAQERQNLLRLDHPIWRLELVAEWVDRMLPKPDPQPPGAGLKPPVT